MLLTDLPRYRASLGDIDEFRMAQDRHREIASQTFKREWHMKCVQIIREEAENNDELLQDSYGHAHNQTLKELTPEAIMQGLTSEDDEGLNAQQASIENI